MNMLRSLPETGWTGQPRFCVLLFGAGPADCVWLAMDEWHVYIDRQAEGHLGGAANRVILPVKPFGKPIDLGEVFPRCLSDPVRLKMHQFRIGPARRVYLHAWFADGRREGARPEWSTEPPLAPVVRFFGPLTFAPAHKAAFAQEPTKFEVLLGRPGAGTDAFAWRNHSDIPHDQHPLAEIRFPGISEVRQYRLDQRCCGCRFHCFVAAPAQSGRGLAEVRVSFFDWPAGDVVPVQLSVPCLQVVGSGA